KVANQTMSAGAPGPNNGTPTNAIHSAKPAPSQAAHQIRHDVRSRSDPGSAARATSETTAAGTHRFSTGTNQAATAHPSDHRCGHVPASAAAARARRSQTTTTTPAQVPAMPVSTMPPMSSTIPTCAGALPAWLPNVNDDRNTAVGPGTAAIQTSADATPASPRNGVRPARGGESVVIDSPRNDPGPLGGRIRRMVTASGGEWRP